jgi:hypothetical protein
MLIFVLIPAVSRKGTLYFTSAYFLFVKKSEQMPIWFDFCELKFNTISIVQRLLSVNILPK